MKQNEIRQKFLKFYEGKAHQILPSSSLVPENDPTLMFANAGMNQFKDIFTGKANPENKRATTCQKVVRAGGKHNDLENVGFTARHHTFFEMLGNFSFGDYFKKEAIAFAWEFLTKELKIDKDKLYVTVHNTDQDAADIWHTQESVPRDRIFFRDDKDNFWEMGELGPCGPSSEIFYDHGEENSDSNADTSDCILDDESRYVEIWNLVFMQYEKYKEGDEVKRRELPKPSVDTGAGLERVAAVMQGVYNNFDTDAFSLIMDKIESIAQKKYQEYPQWFRVIADHARSSTMLLADGVIPSNEGRGYVLRRIIRRAIRHLDLLGVTQTSFYELVDIVFESFGGEYEKEKANRDFIIKYLKVEEDSFRKTLKSGLKLLEKEIIGLEKTANKTLSGKSAFVLYDTHGFPIDLTEMILKEKGLSLDEQSFEEHMKIQKERSKKAGDFSAQDSNVQPFYEVHESFGDTEFVGYESLEIKAKLLKRIVSGDKVFLVFNKTPFYAEGGGQVGDCGEIFDNESLVSKVFDTKKPVDGIFTNLVEEAIPLEEGREYTLKVDREKRSQTMANHTATHLLQAALIKVLGNHVKQAGSSVGPSRLRFDFTQPEGLTKEQIKDVEKLVNYQIQKRTQVCAKIMSKDEAMEMGAMALFGEKYGNEVRVLNIPGFSVELCGGTHVENTSDIGYFKILSEGSLASGIRRIEATTGIEAFNFIDSKINILETIETKLKAKDEKLLTKVDQLQDNLSDKTKEIKALKEKIQSMNAKNMFDGADKTSSGLDFKNITLEADGDLRKIGDLFLDKYPNGVLFATQSRGDKTSVLIKTFKNNSALNCSNILKDVASKHGARGGGKPDMAQGAIPTDIANAFGIDVISAIMKL